MPPQRAEPTFPGLQVQTVGAARVLWLNRPERRNALTPELARSLTEQILAAEHEPQLRVIVLRGAGGHFCVGLDLKWFVGLGATAPRSVLESGLATFQDVIRTIVRSPLPVVAALEGSVAGFGLDVALACDLRIASATASLATAFAQIGLVPDGGSTFTLARLAGRQHALAMLLAGEAVDAPRAHAMGLVGQVLPPEQFEAGAMALAQRIAAQASGSVARIKELVRREEREGLDHHLKLEGRAQLKALQSKEFRTRLEAFVSRARDE